ncbi:MAG: dTMP kinase [Methanomassiliicoccaceae archaeon]|jgi:dTMP kinase|nr:dTMP kinase [Methanomassiliicoccaceae archaeon]
MKKGVFIVFEGIDGSGKSTCMDAVTLELEKMTTVMKTVEPTRDKTGLLIRSSMEMTPETEALLFTADRAEHTVTIKRWMAEGNTVLCDRYFASTLAYQSANLHGRSVDMQWLKILNDKVSITPDMTFLFDIDPKTALERVEKRGSKSKFEDLGYLKEVRKNYLNVAKEYGFIVIDASRSKGEVFTEVMKHISTVI